MRGHLRQRTARPKDYWEIEVDAGRDPVTGQRQRVLRSARGTKREARAGTQRVGRGGQQREGAGDERHSWGADPPVARARPPQAVRMGPGCGAALVERSTTGQYGVDWIDVEASLAEGVLMIRLPRPAADRLRSITVK
jgi:hypothetical protein